MWELDHEEGWALKNWWVLELWCWRRLLRVPWIARRSNQLILKEMNPEYSLEGLMLKHQYFDYLMWKANLLENTLMLGKIEGRRRKGWQRMRWLDGIIESVQFSSLTQSRPTLCYPMNHRTPGLPVHHQLPESTQTHVHGVSDAIQPSHPLSSPSPPAHNPSQHQGLLQWINSSHEVAKVLEFHL